MDLDQYDDSQSDSGVSVDFSPNSMSDNETPIEREIRLAFKREQSLRRSRGLDETKELIEIPLRKSILSRGQPEKPVKDHGKERQFAGKKMEREIHVEAEREKALVKLGRLPGFYDKGTVRQLQEKKLLFEAFQESKDLQITSNTTLEPSKHLEINFQKPSPAKPTETSLKDLQISNNQDHETFRTVQEPMNTGTSCVSSFKTVSDGNQNCSSKETTRHLKLDSSLHLFPSLKEKKLLFESLRENKDAQISRDQTSEGSGALKERRKSLDIFFQNQNPGLKSIQEPKSLQSKRNQDDKISGISNEQQKKNLQKVQNPKLHGPGFMEAVDQQVVIIENNSSVITKRQVHNPLTITDSGSVQPSADLHQNSQTHNQTDDDKELKENPFFKLRSSQSLLPDVQKDIQEAKKREEELRKQRMSLYGNRSKVSASPSRTKPTNNQGNTLGQHMNTTPGQHLNNTPGEHLNTTPGRHLNSTPGQHMNTTPGQHLNNTPGQHLNTTPGRHLNSTPGQHLNTTQEQKLNTTPGQPLNPTPVSSSFGKLDLTWPPPSLHSGHKTQSELKEQRQTNVLIQRWEFGLVNGHGN